MRIKIWILVLILKSFTLLKAETELQNFNDIHNLLRTLNNNLGLNSFEQFQNINSKINTDELCKNQTKKILNDVMNLEIWALKLIDSWGGIPSGIFNGHLRNFGNYDECLDITKTFTDLGVIRGKHCMIQLPIEKILEFINSTKIPSSLYKSDELDLKKLNLEIGICVPEVCSLEFIDLSLRKFIENKTELQINSSLIGGQCIEYNEIVTNFDTLDYIVIAFFSIIALIMLLSTIYDYFMRKKEYEPKLLFIAFSIITNGEKLFKIQKIKSPNVIECLNGIRCLSMIWIVYDHGHVVTAQLNVINQLDMYNWLKEFSATIILQGSVSVDSFFFLSGFLLTWTVYKEMNRTNGKLNILMMYVHRYIRLTPILAVAIIFLVSLNRHIGSGPLWKLNQMLNTKFCEEKWWATLLYVQNYASDRKICIGHSWYLAVDTQLYFFSPLILIPLYKWGKKFVPVIVILALLSIGCVFTVMMKYNFGPIISEMGEMDGKYMKLVYIGTQARYSPWLVGILLAFAMYKLKNQRTRLFKSVVICGWIIAIGTMIAIICGPYWRMKGNPEYIPSVENAFHASLHRVSWSIALAWIVFACHNGYGSIINSTLSWSIWQPLGRLTYSIYIFHMIIQYIINGNVKADTHFSEFEMMLRFWGDFGLTLTVAIITVLAFESPILGLENVIFRRNLVKRADKENLVINNNEIL